MKKIVLVGFSFLVLFAVFACPWQVTLSVALGWLLFLHSTLPRVRVDWPSVGVGGVAVVLFIAGVHALGTSWRRRDPERRWKLRWSSAGVADVFVLFAAGVSLVAIVHQIGWMLTSPGPMYVQTLERGSGYSPNNLKQIGLAMQNYNGSFGGVGPPGGTFTPQGQMLHSWETYTLVYIGYSTSDIDWQLPWNHPRNEKYFKGVLPVFANGRLPSPPLVDESGFGLSHYAANSHVLGPNKNLRLDHIGDGLANTLLIGEVNADFQPWGHPVNWRDPAKGINRSRQGFGGPPYAGGAYFSMADGSVRFVNERIAPEVLRALATPNGGEKVDASIGDAFP
jgi:hypothetical protein